MNPEITWKNIFNTSFHLWGTVHVANSAANKSKYPYYSWNGRIFATNDATLTPVAYLEGKDSEIVVPIPEKDRKSINVV